MKVKVYAGLKAYFEPMFDIPEAPVSVGELRKKLLLLNPEAEKLLGTCRFAVVGTFVEDAYGLEEVEEVLVMPPSSGG